MKNKIVILIIFTIIFVIIFIFSNNYQKDNRLKINNINSKITVSVERACGDSVKEILAYTGTISPSNFVSVISQTYGIILESRIKIGKRCNKGDTLVFIENDMQKANLEQAHAQLITAQANYDKAEKDLKRAENLFADSALSEAALESIRLSFQSAKAQLKSAIASYELSKKQLKDTYIMAPIKGLIVSKKLDVGNTISQGTEICNIVDDSYFKTTIMVSEQDINKIRVKMSADVKIDVIPHKTFKAHVSSVSYMPQPQTRLYPVEITLISSDQEEIKSGMFCHVYITTKEIKNSVTISEQAICFDDSGNSYVYLFKNNIAKKIPIITGIKYQGKQQIISGINNGDTVILSGKEKLTDGSELIIKKVYTRDNN